MRVHTSPVQHSPASQEQHTTALPNALSSLTPHNVTKTFSFPKTMLFSQQLTVTGVQQVNHDTKRITFSLPGGKQETTGVPASGTFVSARNPPPKLAVTARP